jgi:hypothetical protein
MITEYLPVVWTAENVPQYVGAPLETATGYALELRHVGTIGVDEYFDILREEQTLRAWRTAHDAARILSAYAAALKRVTP